MQDVADRAGVSLTTVSFVVNGTKRVAPSTRARVEEAMADLGYRRNVLARALASRRSHIVALVFPALQHRLGSTALSIVTAAARAATERGFNVVLWPVDDVAQLDDYLSGGLVDGVLLMEVTADDPRVALLVERDVHFGLVGRTDDTTGLSYVDMDFAGMVATGLDHLTELGHRRVALFLGDPGGPAWSGYGPVARTEQAYLAEAARRGLDPVVVRSAQDPRSGRRAATALAEDHPDVTAVLVLNELALSGFVNGLVAAGRTVPDDVSVLGLATSAADLETADPAVSAVVAPGAELGARSVDGLVDRLTDPTAAPTHDLLPGTLRLVGSTAAPR
ncbi:LacI family DNA-binding transcriptional regulator [Cellulosimicrobium sp. TH-20]|uniref:LacI family DNA-binding transcriptional regulator n=1 Tax=Cellulosimicrobium sp. TH-20 TaxID=1980001 RepID=UPI002102B9FD|nr:LacI family DNA-binding transcriptional regulator [Cellulosimicrobium sp. TH-20]